MPRFTRQFAGLLIAFATVVALLALQHALGADTAPQTLPFSQNWTSTTLIVTGNDWSGVPGVVGYRGDGMVPGTGADPQSVLADGSATPQSVLANQTNPNTNTTGAVAEFEITDPTIAFQGSGTARAPHIVISLSTSGFAGINVSYNLRDIDGSADNSVQPVALQYRVGGSGNYTNIPAAFVPDASTGPGLATLVTPVGATLPAGADNQPLIQLRVITTDAVGSDEWIGVDDIVITGSPTASATNPSAVGGANPISVIRGQATLLTAVVTPGTNPASTGLGATVDLSAIGGSAAQPFFDNGTNGDTVAGDNTFSYQATVSFSTTGGLKTLQGSVTDGQARAGSFSISLNVLVPASLPFTQDWTNRNLIVASDDWSGVPGIIGYRGDSLASGTSVDPLTVLADGSSTPVDVNANQSNPNTFSTGGVTEFDGIVNPTIAIKGSSTASAPHVVVSLNTTGVSDVLLSYNLRDLDGSANSALQPVALQYRIGATGPFTNLVEGSVPDATDGPNAGGRITPIFVHLPNSLGNQPFVQIRFITTDAVGTDEWVGIDDISVTDGALATSPSGAGSAIPDAVGVGETTLLTVRVTSGSNPASSGLSVVANLSLIGGAAAQPLFDDGTHDDAIAGDSTFSYLATVAAGTSIGPTSFQATVSDAQQRSSLTDISLNVLAATDPTAVGAASPGFVVRGFGTLLTVAVTPGAHPASSGVAVAADLSTLGGLANQPLFDTGTGGDLTPGDNIFSLQFFISSSTAAGLKTIPALVSDAQSRTASTAITFTVLDPPPPGQALPFFQNWSNTGLISANDNWSGVPGIVGYLGDDGSTTATNINPQTLLSEDLSSTPDAIANQANPNALTTGGVAEFDGIPNPTVALQGSGTADAPNIVIGVETTNHSSIVVSYSLRDIDGSPDNAPQQVALQYRAGNAGPFTNVPAGYVADASSGPALATRITPVFVQLPPDADNKPLVQIRIMTSNAAGSDEWIGVDDIFITDASSLSNPLGLGSAAPSVVEAGHATLLTVTVIPAANPPSTGLAVAMHLGPIDGSSVPQPLFDDGTNGDVTAGDHVFSINATVGLATTAGQKTLSGVVSDAEGRSSSTSIPLTVISPPPPIQSVTISQLQGSGSISPFKDQPVSTEGVITGVKSNGFFIQTPDGTGDADPNTSEAVFVFTGNPVPATAAVGNLVSVAGVVQEFVPNADPLQRPVTEIGGSPTVVVLSTGNPLPAPVALTAADTTPGGGLEQLERFEGMRVRVSSFTVTGATLGGVNESAATSTSSGVFYGVITGVDRPFREPGIEVPDSLPAGAPATVPRFDGNPERLQVDSDGLGGAKIEVAAGDIVTNLVGPLDYAFRTYMILPDPLSPPIVFNITMPVPTSVPAPTQFTVASANLERFFDTVNDPLKDDAVLTETAFNARLNKASLFFRDILHTPDLVGVEEMENLSTLQLVAARINADSVAANEPNPNYVAYLEEGNDIGGIDVGFLVRTARVSVVDVTQVGKGSTYINPNNGQPELLNDRPSLVLRAIVRNQSGADFPLTVIVNHLRSLSGVDDPADGNRVRSKRRAQAEEVASFVQARQAADPGEHIISIGDYNAFQFNDGFVDSIGTIKGTPAPADQVTLPSTDLVHPHLIDLVEAMPASQRYSFVFDGNAQVLDHHLITQNLLGSVESVQFGRVDADFPESARGNPLTPTRVSDHDPLVSYFRLPQPLATQTTVQSSLNPSAFGQNVTFTATVLASGRTVTEGAVSFREGNTLLAGPVHLNSSGIASFSTSSLAVGDHVLTAIFSGTRNFNPSSGSVVQAVRPGLSINNVSVTERNKGTKAAVFFVTLSPASTQTVTVDVTTADGTATSPSDYLARPPTTLTFPAGSTTQSIAVTVINDLLNERDENFFVNLSNPTNAVTTNPQGLGTITNDDPLPNLRIRGHALREGDNGTRNLTFFVRLSRPSGEVVMVDFTTAGGTAHAGTDFISQAGTLSFAPSTTTQCITVPIIGDLIGESTEVFFVNLSNAANAVIADAQGKGTIINDDHPRRETRTGSR